MSEPIQTNRRETLGQLLICRGQCCGRTDLGRPDVPVERLKAVWRAETLSYGVHLTISACLGPCDVPNVALVIGRDGAQWLAKLGGDDCYNDLIDWARACKIAGQLLPLPERFAGHELQRFSAPSTEIV